MAINKAEISQLKLLMKESAWETLLRLLGEHMDAINAEDISGTNEFETLRMLHTNQGKVDGLKEFFDQLERKAFE